RYGTWRMEWEGFHLRRPRVRLPVHASRPDNRYYLPVHAGRPGNRDCLPVHAGCLDNRDRLPDHASRVTFPIPITTRAIIQQRMRRSLGYLDGSHRRYAFTKPEDLPRARVVWESTSQTNLRKSMWEARDKAMKTTSSRDPTAWLDYGPIWLRKDYWESLCHRCATGPSQEWSQAAKRNRATHPEKNVHTSGSVSYATHSQKLVSILFVTSTSVPLLTFRELLDRTHKRKGTDDYVSESARTIVETYDKTMADRYAEGTPQPDLDPEAWVDAAGGPKKGRVYGFGDSLDTTSVLSSYASSVAPPAYASLSAAPPGSGGEDMRTLIWEELQTQFGVMVKQLISAIQGVCPS
ncbi:hypothetical protein Taro_030023, partial [Colocasia esculenta]|nr:hypothetical protein [Colocasia esculenta]